MTVEILRVGKTVRTGQDSASTPLPRIGKGFLELGTGKLSNKGSREAENEDEEIIRVRSHSEDT